MKGSQFYQILHYSIHASEGNSKYKISVTTQISNSNVVILICLVILLHKLSHLARKS